jgi:hypothetical protein
VNDVPPPIPADVRVVVLACRAERLAIAGGGILRLAPGTPCPPAASGRPFAITLDADGSVVVRLRVVMPGETLAAPEKIPAAAYAVAPRRPAETGENVETVVDVYVPARTPATDDVYLSTERSNWNASELRMNRVDARRFTTTLVLRRGTTLPLRVTRGSFATYERDAARTLPAPHVVRAGEPLRIDVPAWADVD